MNAHPALKRLLEATIFAVLAGAIGYGVTAWLAPEGVSALTVAAIVAAIASLAVLVPSGLLEAFAPTKRRPWSAPDDLYYSLEYRLTNHTGFEAHAGIEKIRVKMPHACG